MRLFDLCVVCTKAISPPANVEWKVAPDPAVDLFLEYREQAVDALGNPVDTLELEGASGCLVWAIVSSGGPSEIWTPPSAIHNQLKVIGVQSSYCHRKFIRAKKLNVLEAALKPLDAGAAASLGAVIRSTAPA